MSKIEIQRVKTETGITVTCDECGKKETKWSGQHSSNSFSKCIVCEHDFCTHDYNCGRHYTEDGDGWGLSGDYFQPDFSVCKCCIEKFEPVWKLSITTAPRNADIVEHTKALLRADGVIK